MFCLYLVVHKEGDEAISKLRSAKAIQQYEPLEYVCINEFVDCCEDVLMSRNIVKGLWSVLFYPTMISKRFAISI